ILRIAGGRGRGDDFLAAGAGEDFAVAFAPAFVVAAVETAVAGDQADIAGTIERRALVAGGEFAEPRYHVESGIVQAIPGARSMGGATVDPAVWQGGDAGAEFHLPDVETERFRGDLGERGPGALPHVDAGGLDQRGTVGPQRRPRLGGKLRTG